MTKIEAKVTIDYRLLMVIFDCIVTTVILLIVSCAPVRAMNDKQQAHVLYTSANSSESSRLVDFKTKSPVNQSIEKTPEGQINTILVNSSYLDDTSSQVQDLDTSDSITKLSRDVNPQKGEIIVVRNETDARHDKRQQTTLLEPKLTAKSQLFLNNIKSKRRLKFLKAQMRPKQQPNQQVVLLHRLSNDTSVSASQNYEDWVDYDSSIRVDTPNMVKKPPSRPMREQIAALRAKTTMAPQVPSSTSHSPVLQVKQESSETKDDDRPMVSKSTTSTTTIGDGKKRAKIVSKSASLPAGLRQRIIEQFIKNGGDPQNIVVSDSTITTTSQSKKKTITTVYKIVPNSSSIGEKRKTRIKVIKPAMVESDDDEDGENDDNNSAAYDGKKDIGLSQLLGHPKRIKNDKSMQGFNKKSPKKIKKIMVTRTEVPHKIFFEGNENPSLPGNNKDPNLQGKQDLGEFYQGPHETIFGINENPGKYNEMQKQAILELDELTDPSINYKGKNLGANQKEPLKVGPLSKGEPDDEDPGELGGKNGGSPAFDDDQPANDEQPEGKSVEPYEIIDKPDVDLMPPVIGSMKNHLTDFKEIKGVSKGPVKKASQHQFGAKSVGQKLKTNEPTQAVKDQKFGANSASQTDEGSRSPPGDQPEDGDSRAPASSVVDGSPTTQRPMVKSKHKPDERGRVNSSKRKVKGQNKTDKRQSSSTGSPVKPEITNSTVANTSTSTTTSTTTTTSTRAPALSLGATDLEKQRNRERNNTCKSCKKPPIRGEILPEKGSINETSNEPTIGGAKSTSSKTHNIMMLIDFGPPSSSQQSKIHQQQSKVNQRVHVTASDGEQNTMREEMQTNSGQSQNGGSIKKHTELKDSGFLPMVRYSNKWQPVDSSAGSQARNKLASQVSLQASDNSKSAPTVSVQIYNGPSQPQVSLPDYGDGSAFLADNLVSGQLGGRLEVGQTVAPMYEMTADSHEFGTFKVAPESQHEQQHDSVASNLDFQPSQLAPSIIIPGESASTNQLVSDVIDELAMASDQQQEQGQPLYPMTASVHDSPSSAAQVSLPGEDDDESNDDGGVGGVGVQSNQLLMKPVQDSGQMQLTSEPSRSFAVNFANSADVAYGQHFGSRQNNRLMNNIMTIG